MLSVFARVPRRRKSWTFEQLEARHYFSFTPLSAGTVTSYSSNTPAGLQAILDHEIAWVIAQQLNQQGTARPLETYAVPNDPYFPFQWHLQNLGQEVGSPDWEPIYGEIGEDINVMPVWDLGITGEGVIVAVIDSGTQTFHPDLAANIDPGFQFDAILGIESQFPDLLDPVNAHGTSVAGLIAAVGNNGIGTTGVAYNAQIVPIRLIDTLAPVTDLQIASALRFGSDEVDIYNNSWGPATGRLAVSLTPAEFLALRDGAQNGRGGLGAIQVFSAGNDASSPTFGGTYSSATYNGFINRYTIGVGGIDHDGSFNNPDGTFTSYPEAGASILVAAPTGSYPLTIGENTFVGSGIWTTDAIGDDGFNVAPLPNGDEPDITRDHFADTDYTSRFNGTSASAPIVSGVIALMLEANPNLTYRDVQEILVRSARQAGEFEIPETGGGIDTNLNSWIVNPQIFFVNPDPYIPGAPLIPAVPDDPNTPIDESLPAVPAGVPTNALNAIYTPRNYVGTNLAGFGLTGIILDYDTHKQPRPTLFANGAGYTVSQGRGPFGEQFGYGHGVIDAELAVKLAQQWTSRAQTLPQERSFTTNIVPPTSGVSTILGAQTGNAGTGNVRVPGGIGFEDFIAYWNEYVPGPMNQGGPFDVNYARAPDPFGESRGGFYHFEIPDESAMTVEWVEVRVNISGDANDMDFLRMTLVSPDGTFSELNDYFDIAPGTANNGRQIPSHPSFIVDPPGEISATDGLVYTFSTNRHWGERYETQVIIDPVTGNPFRAGTGQFGEVVRQGWELHFENFSGTDFNLNSVEVIWHGSPIEASSQRVQGAVGIDSGRFGVGARDGFFNFDRYFQSVGNFDNDWIDLNPDGRRDFFDANNNRVKDPGEEFSEPDSIDFNEVRRFADPFQERFAENIIVTATRVSDGVEVASFVTGADGNFYFDLTPDEYIITVTDPLGRLAMDEANVPANRLAHYQNSWHITEDWFYVPQVDSSVPNDFRVEVDAQGVPIPYSFGLEAGVKNLNFLLDPGPLPANEVVVTGQVFADLDGDGTFNGDDVGAAGFIVYADTNENGQFEVSDVHVNTDANGNYSLPIPTFDQDRFLIGAVPLNGLWTQTSPTTGDGFHFVIGGPGDIRTNANFGFQPMEGTFGGNFDGVVLGVVFQDLPTELHPEGDGVRQAFESGIPNLRVFNDLDSGGTWTAGEPFAFTAANGAYFLPGVGPGDVRVTVELPEDEPGVPSWAFSLPESGFRIINVVSGEAETNHLFGLVNLATNDWGDLLGYPTTEAQNGPRHPLNPGFQLGATLDGEVSAKPTANADGDDLHAMDDEDGVVIVSNGGLLQPGANTLRVTVQGVGGYLHGWIDWNNNGSFDDPGDEVFANLDLNPGTHDLVVDSGANMAGGPLAARFRWGSADLSYVGADPNYGEVEDYRLANSLQPILMYPAGDYDRSGLVDQGDFVLWKATYGSSDLRADGNNDGQVNSADYTVWRNNVGAAASFGAGSASGAGSESLAAGASLTSLDPAAARAAAFERAMAVQGLSNGPLHWGPNERDAAALLAAGAVPMTIRVGNGTQTVYYFPSTESSTGSTVSTGGAVSVASQSPSRPSFQAAAWLGDTLRSSADRSDRTVIAADESSLAAAGQIDLTQLLETVWSSYQQSDEFADESLLAASGGDEDEDAMELAVAALFTDDVELGEL
jgi:subtilisin family serine protease